MSVEVNVVGMRCGAKNGALSCSYCYEGAVRRASENAGPKRIDHEAIQATLEASGGDGFSLFGGEPLLASLEDIERLWAYGLERYGTNGVQTGGRPITEAHLELFRRYKVSVGFSIDGPEELNDARRAGSIEQTREATAHSIAMLRRCLAEGIECSLIVTLHRLNAAPGRLPRLLEWFRELDAAGLSQARLHILEVDGPGAALALTTDENVRALWSAHRLEAKLQRLRFDVFADLRKKLLDPSASVTCIWEACDPWTTPAVHGIEADGSRSLCQRVHKDGRQWVPMSTGSTRIRQAVLWATPQGDGGCRDCRFFLQCAGQCPGTAIDGDWRKRSRDCGTWYRVLEQLEAELVAQGEVPASLAPGLVDRIEEWLAGAAAESQPHGDAPHGDQPHGDHDDAPSLAGGELVRAAECDDTGRRS